MNIGLKIPNVNESVTNSFAKAIENMDRLGSLADITSRFDKGVGLDFGKLAEVGNNIAPVESNLQ